MPSVRERSVFDFVVVEGLKDSSVSSVMEKLASDSVIASSPAILRVPSINGSVT